jgi:hypothetical protein
MAMKTLKLAATLLSSLALAVVGTTSVSATSHETVVSGFEMYATSTEGRFSGTATGQGQNGLWGAWSIVVDHTTLDPCGQASTVPCAWVTGGSFALAVTSPTVEYVTGTFNPQDRLSVPGADGISVLQAGWNCTTQEFKITDGLSHVGTGSQPSGSGRFVGYLWHHRHWVFGRCLTYAATVQGNVVLEF